MFGPKAKLGESQFAAPLKKPIGFSQFPREITKPPRHWIEAVHNLVYYRKHEVSLSPARHRILRGMSRCTQGACLLCSVMHRRDGGDSS